MPTRTEQQIAARQVIESGLLAGAIPGCFMRNDFPSRAEGPHPLTAGAAASRVLKNPVATRFGVEDARVAGPRGQDAPSSAPC
jgi:hypothetical protein